MTLPKVEVYFNLHKKVWSVRENGRVKHHANAIILKNAKFVVQPAGREKVLREQKKNVHAFVRGDLEIVSTSNDRLRYCNDRIKSMSKVTYNPYKKDHFFYVANGRKIEYAETVIMFIDHESGNVYVG